MPILRSPDMAVSSSESGGGGARKKAIPWNAELLTYGSSASRSS
jgi:hypothetical protein